ncbi:MAG: nicotinate phosphoribosyltransferase [Halanaerobiales bacterium]|nr:nicotinate phosphoribosyltransferase [Halanaerobiales bacterium]
MRNLSMLTDFYQLTMAQGYYKNGMKDLVANFDVYYRRNPFDGGYSIFAGLEQVIEYIDNFGFYDEDIEYFRSLNTFDEDFLQYLSNIKFTGDILSVPEGTLIFPKEPIMRITASIIEAQLIETTILNIINHQSLIATKSSRIRWAIGKDDILLEFGLRRAQGADAGVFGARAAIIGGCNATSNVLASQLFGTSPKGTHAHSWVMSFESEIEAFRKYAEIYPDACILLVDTFDTLKCGVPNAIKVFEELKEKGVKSKLYGIRLDSGDIAYLSKKARKMLDRAGFPDAVISASNDLDEKLIQSLKIQGAKVTTWGVGTNLITAKDDPAFGGVYKLSALKINDSFVPKLKVSNNIEKITNPGLKRVLRFYAKDHSKMIADLVILDHENFSSDQDIILMDEHHSWKKMVLKSGSFAIKDLLEPIYVDGKLFYEVPSLNQIKEYCRSEMNLLSDGYKRFENPHIYHVNISDDLYNMKKGLIRSNKSCLV